MDLKTAQNLAVDVADIYAARFDVPRSSEWTLLKLSEEVGELTGAWLQSVGQSRGAADLSAVSDEFADVLGFLLVFAAREGIDPAAALSQKWGAYLPEREAPSS